MQLNERKTSHLLSEPETNQRLLTLITKGDCFPPFVVIHPTMVCNHRCDFCNYFYTIDNEKIKFNSINKDIFVSYLKDFNDVGVKTLILSGGGDPLLHKDIDYILENILLYNFSKHIYTNLDFSLKNKVIEMLSCFDSVNININTGNHEVYKATRGLHTNLDRVISNLKKLNKRNCILNAVCIVRDNKLSELRETIDFLNLQGFQKITVSPAFDFDYQDKIRSSDRTIDKMYSLLEITKDYSNVKLIKQVENVVYDVKGNVYCKTHYFDITIGADYKVYPCCMVAYEKGYDILDLKKFSSFIDAWCSEERKQIITNQQYSCSKCWFGNANSELQKLINI